MAKRRAIPGNLPQTGGGGGGSLQPGDVGTTELANGAVTKVKLSATGGSAGDGLYISADGDLVWLAPGDIPDASLTPVKLSGVSTGASYAGTLLGLDPTNGTAFHQYAQFSLSNGDITPALAGLTTGASSAGKPVILDATNGTDFDLGEFPTFSLSAGDIDSSNLFAAGVVDANAIGADQVGLSELNIDGTAAAGKVAKVYDDGGTLKLQWADDNNSGGGGGGNVTLPLDLASSTNFSGLNPVARGGTGASTAAAARLNLGAAAAGSVESDDGSLPYITDANATPDDHQGRYDDSTANRPDTGSTGGVIWEIEDNQVALETEGSNSGALWVRTKTETNDTAWTSPANANATQITTIAAWRGLGFDTVRESTLASAHPQQTSVDCAVTKIRGGFAGTGYFILIVSGSTNPPAWWAEVPSGNSWTGSDLVWTEWGNAPNYDVDSDVYQDYRKIPAGRVGLVPSLNISSTIQRDALVAHGFASNSSTFTAYSYSGGNLQSSTIGRTVTAGSWAKAQIGTDQIEDEAITEPKIDDDIVTQDGSGNVVVTAPIIDLHTADFPGYSVVANSNQLSVGSGRIWFDYPNRRFFAAERSDVEHGLLSRIFNKGFELTITGTSSGDTGKYVEGVLTQRVTLPGGLVGGIFRDDWGISAVQFAAGDTVTIAGKPAFLNKDDTIKLANLGLTHGTSNANRIVYTDAEGDGFTTLDHITPTELPTVLADIQAINERLTVEQLVRGEAFGTTYSHSASYAGVTAGRFRWIDTTRILTIHPLSADSTLPEYLLPGVQWELTSSNGARILGTVEAVVANPAGTPAGAYSVRIRNTAHHYTGDIRSGTVTIKTNGAFIGRDEAAVGLPQLDIDGTQAANKWLRVNSANSKLEYTDAPSGGGGSGDTFTEDNYESKVYSGYANQATVADLAAGERHWDSTNSRLTIRPKSGDTDLSAHLPAGSLVDLRGASSLRLKGIITRADNPDNAPSDAFTIQFDTTGDNLYRKSSGWDASTASVDIHALSKVLSWDTVGSPISGGFGAITASMLDMSNTGSLHQHVGVTSVDSGRIQLGYLPGPTGAAVKHRMGYKQEVSGVGELSNVGLSRVPMGNSTSPVTRTNGTQTGEWTMANRSTDWISFNSGGLAYFGHIPAQPICLDIRVWVRWKTGTDTYQNWNLSNSRVEEINLGSDGLMVVKLFAGGMHEEDLTIGGTPYRFLITAEDPAATDPDDRTFYNEHVDCAYGTGIKTIKLSELPSGVVDGADFQLTLAYQKQNPSPDYTVRRSWFTADIVDGNAISFNY